MVRWHESRKHRHQLFCPRFPHLTRLLLKASSKWGELIPDQFEIKWTPEARMPRACVREMTSWHLPAFLLLTTGGRLSQLNKQADQSKTCQTKGIMMKYWGFVNKIYMYMQWICTYYLPFAQKRKLQLKGQHSVYLFHHRLPHHSRIHHSGVLLEL